MKTQYIILDTETSGLTPKDTILQLAYQRFDHLGRELDTFKAYICPQFPYEIHEKAFEAHGLTKEFLEENGYVNSQIVSMLARLMRFANDGWLFVGHNFSFDWRMITQDAVRYEVPRSIEIEYYCTQNAKEVKAFVGAVDVNGKPKAPNLAELHAKLFGTDFDGAHDALADVRATAKCFFELKRRGIIAV